MKLRRKIFSALLLGIVLASHPCLGQFASVDECVDKISHDLYYKTDSYAKSHGKLLVTVVLEGEAGIGRGIVSRLQANTMLGNRISFLSVTKDASQAGADKLVINVYAMDPNYIIKYEVLMGGQPIARAETPLSQPLANSIRESEPVAYDNPRAQSASRPETPRSSPARSSSSNCLGEIFTDGIIWILIIGAVIYFSVHGS
jgi:hypothetical protein